MKAINFTNFEVVSSDCGESYVWLRREFATAIEGAKFKIRLERMIEEQAEKNVFQLVRDVDEVQFAYIPLIKVLADDYYENAYDKDGEPIDEYEPNYMEQYVAIYSMFCTQSTYYRGPEAPCVLNIKMTIGIPAEDFEQCYEGDERKIVCYDDTIL